MENHHFHSVNQPFLWPCSIAVNSKLLVYHSNDGIYGCLWMFMDVYGCLRMFTDVLLMFMDAYGCLWMFMDVYGCLTYIT